MRWPEGNARNAARPTRELTRLYFWLKFGHIAGIAVFLFGHGMAAGCSYGLTQRPAPSITTGIWMGFVGHWWSQGWIWRGIAVLIALFVAMGMISLPYHRAREATADDLALGEQLARTRPGTAGWIGAVGLLALIFLMVFKPF